MFKIQRITTETPAWSLPWIVYHGWGMTLAMVTFLVIYLPLDYIGVF